MSGAEEEGGMGNLILGFRQTSDLSHIYSGKHGIGLTASLAKSA